jgi:putative inorganic carbon (HCO3(-)) transporter
MSLQPFGMLLSCPNRQNFYMRSPTKPQEVVIWPPAQDLWVTWSIAGLAASVAALFICQPSLVLVGLLISLMLAAATRFDLVIYWFIFSLPWYPLFDLPVRDVYLLLRVVLFFGVWILVRRKNRSVREWLIGSRLKKGMILFVGIAATSFFSSGIPADAHAYRELALLVSYVMVFFAFDGWLESSAQIARVLKLLLVSTIGVALFGFYQAIVGGYTELYFRLYPFEKQVIAPWSGRITSFLFQENSLAGYLNLVMPFAIACAVLAKDRSLKFLGFVCACAGTVAMVLTQSRGGLLALAGVLIAGLWFLVPRLITRLKLLGGGVVVCMLLVPALLNQFERLQDTDDGSRMMIWTAAGTLFFEHPLLGVGFGNFRFLSPELVPGGVMGYLDAHNIYLQLLAGTGIFGFLSFFILLGFFILLALKSGRGEDPIFRIVAFGVLGAITSTLIHGVVDYLFNASPQFGALFWIILALGSRALPGSSSKMVPTLST